MPVSTFVRGSGSGTAPAVDESLLEAVRLALRIDGEEFDTELSRNIQAATERADRQAPDAPDATKREAIIRFCAWLHEGAQTEGAEAGIWRRAGSESLLGPWTIRRGGMIG